MFEIKFGVISGFSGSIKEISNKRNRILVLLGYGIESSIVNTESESTVLLLDKEYWSSSRRTTRPDESVFEILVDEVTESLSFVRRELVYTAEWRSLAIFEFYLQIIRTMQRKLVSKSFREDIGKIMILSWNV